MYRSIIICCIGGESEVCGKNQKGMRAQSINKQPSTGDHLLNRIAVGTSGVCKAFKQQCELQSTDCMMMPWDGEEKSEKWVLLWLFYPHLEPLRAHRSDHQHHGTAGDAPLRPKHGRGRAEPAAVGLRGRKLKRGGQVSVCCGARHINCSTPHAKVTKSTR